MAWTRKWDWILANIRPFVPGRTYLWLLTSTAHSSAFLNWDTAQMKDLESSSHMGCTSLGASDPSPRKRADLHHWPLVLCRAWGQLSESGGLFGDLTLIRVLFMCTENPEELNISGTRTNNSLRIISSSQNTLSSFFLQLSWEHIHQEWLHLPVTKLQS